MDVCKAAREGELDRAALNQVQWATIMGVLPGCSVALGLGRLAPGSQAAPTESL